MVKWDATCYADMLPKNPSNRETQTAKTKEARLKLRYPPLDRNMETTSCIIVDMHGIILTWYLPGILSDSRQVSLLLLSDISGVPDTSQNAMLAAGKKLHPLLNGPKDGGYWRNDPKYFNPKGEDPLGSIDLSPAWFPQGHDVSASADRVYFLTAYLNQATVQKNPQVSVSFKSQAASDWLDAISESNAILSAILAVIHPTLYDAGWQTTKRLRDTPEIGADDILNRWASIFSGVSIICNRFTPPHRDTSSRWNWYDILTTLGSYRECNMKLPGLGLTLEYGPGAVVGISGKILEHAVPSFKGDRVCYAYFIRNNVHEWAKVPGSDWMHTKFYE